MSKRSIPKTTPILPLLQAATIALFVGRAWQHLAWDAPFRALLWDETWMKGIVNTLLGMPWEAYITSLAVDDAIQTSIKGFGFLYLACALVALLIRRIPKWSAKLLWVGTAGLVFLAFLYCKERFFSIGQFFEYSLQIVAPLMLYFWVFPKGGMPAWSNKNYIRVLKIATALTFICHGLYAVNYYPRPGNFVEMVINTIGVTESAANHLLLLAGLLDFLAALGLFLPWKWGRVALGYIIFWGIATTMARYTSYLEWEYLGESLSQWTWEVLVRLPHFLLPLVLYFLWKQRSSNRKPDFYG